MLSAEPNGFWLPKAGNSDADYEDAFAIARGRVAIADGATESSFARAWAEALVNGFTTGLETADALAQGFSPDRDTVGVTVNGFAANLDAAEASAQGWTADIEAAGPASNSGDDISRPPTPGDGISPLAGDAATVERYIAPLQRAWHKSIAWDRLPWFAEDKARSGAFATLLAFEFVPRRRSGTPCEEAGDFAGSASLCWRAMAVGDSCLFQLRDEGISTAFPIARADEFNSRPLLLSSNPANNGRVWESVRFCDGDARPGDVFLFATDALAHWFLAEAEAGRQPWHLLLGLQSQAEFAAFVAQLRGSHAIRNDDVTLIRIAVQVPSREGFE